MTDDLTELTTALQPDRIFLNLHPSNGKCILESETEVEQRLRDTLTKLNRSDTSHAKNDQRTYIQHQLNQNLLPFREFRTIFNAANSIPGEPRHNDSLYFCHFLLKYREKTQNLGCSFTLIEPGPQWSQRALQGSWTCFFHKFA